MRNLAVETEDPTPDEVTEPEEQSTGAPLILLDDSSVYAPLAVFLNPILNRCTISCKNEPGHFVNPAEVNILDHLDRAEGIPDDDRANDDTFHSPYMTCDCEVGWIQLSGGECWSCSNIDDGCCDCSFETDGTAVCDACRSVNQMVAPDDLSCQHKIAGCSVGFDDQPDGLPSPADVNGDGSSEYYCPKCDDGWFLNTDDNAGYCERCNSTIDECTLCSTNSRCIECREPYFPSWDQTECRLPIEFCETAPSNYHNDGDTYVCNQCFTAYYSDDDECIACPIGEEDGLHASCLDCDDEDNCIECAGPDFLDHDHGDCMSPYANCAVKPHDYTRNEDHHLVCPQCMPGYVWFEDECAVCATAYPNCAECDHFMCTECDSNYEFSPNYECWNEIPNCDDDSYEDHDIIYATVT